MTDESAAPRRGLVLGGGGILGAAWMVGALKAVEEIHGFDPRTADYIVGTSIYVDGGMTLYPGFATGG